MEGGKKKTFQHPSRKYFANWELDVIKISNVLTLFNVLYNGIRHTSLKTNAVPLSGICDKGSLFGNLHRFASANTSPNGNIWQNYFGFQ